MAGAEEFVANFTSFWKDPSLQRIPEILHPEIVLLQPLAQPMRGIEAATEEFGRIWKWLPDLRAEVDWWRGDSELVFIEFRLRAHLNSEFIEWPNVDRFLLRDGKAIERMNYFDPVPLVRKVSKHPSVWWPWLKSGAVRPWRSGHGIGDYTPVRHRAE